MSNLSICIRIFQTTVFALMVTIFAQAQQKNSWALYYHTTSERGFFLEENLYQNEFGWIVLGASQNTLHVPDSSSMTIVFNYGTHDWPIETTSGRRGNRTYTFEKCCIELGSGTYKVDELIAFQQKIFAGIVKQSLPSAAEISELVICNCNDMTFSLKVRNTWDEVIETLTTSNGVVYLPFQKSMYKDKSNFPLLISIEGQSNTSAFQYRLYKDVVVKAP